MKSQAAALSLVLLAGCVEPDCTTRPASMELHLSVPGGLAIRSLAIEVTMGELRGSKQFELLDQLDDGNTSLEVILEDAPSELFDVTIWVAAYGEDRGVLARGSGDFTAEPNSCNRFELALIPPQPIDPPDAGHPPPEPDAGIDTGTIDPPPQPDAAPPNTPDAGIDADSGTIPEPGNCNAADPNTVALYDFDHDVDTTTISDATGTHHGHMVGGSPNYTDGPDGCGRALVFPSGGNVQEYGYIPDSQQWDLSEGSVDLWLLLRDRPPRNERLGVLARDADGNGRGRFSIRAACDGTLVAKIEAGDTPYYQCSNAPVPRDAWTHVTVNFGPPGFELRIDGAVQTRSGAVGLLDYDCLQTVQCGTSTTAGIAGNAFPWILGADATEVNNNMFTALDAPLDNSAIDHFSVSNVRR